MKGEQLFPEESCSTFNMPFICLFVCLQNLFTYFVIKTNDKKSRRFDPSEVIFDPSEVKMTSEGSKRRDFLSLVFITKSISKRLLIKIVYLFFTFGYLPKQC